MNRIFKRTVTAASLIVLGLVVAVVLLPAALGYQRYIITGGSMTGTIDKGSIVYSKLTPVTQLKRGDIITFVPPGETGAVTHRISSVEKRGGQLQFRTKGDFNKTVDPWTVTFSQPLQPRYVYHLPYAGYALAALSLRPVRLLAIALPALLLAVSLLWSLWASAGEEARRQEAGPLAAGEPALARAENPDRP